MKLPRLNSLKTYVKTKKTHSDLALEHEWQNFSQSYQNVTQSCSWSYCDSQQTDEVVISKNIELCKTLNKCMVEEPTHIEIICIDEGVQICGANRNTIQIAIPGSGILMPENIDIITEKLQAMIDNNTIRSMNITSHSNCGAACLATRNKLKKISGRRLRLFSDRISDKVGQMFVQSFTNKLRRSFSNQNVVINNSHIQQIDRPNFHHAFGAIINFIPELNLGLFEKKTQLPMFGISAFMIEEDEILEEILLSYDIATGAHGFHNKFNEEEPFEVIATIRRDDDAIRIHRMFENMKKRFSSHSPVAYSIVQVES